ncbi:MAG: hypothetical protein Fur0041_20250 [Bacteroidia bacterium]
MSFLILCVLSVQAQKKYTLLIHENRNEKIISSSDYKKEFTDILQRDRELNNLLKSLWNSGYIAARYDSIRKDSLHLQAWIDPGIRYEWLYISKGNADEEMVSTSGFHEKSWKNKKLRYSDVFKIHESILKWCENNGYPFASVSLDSIQIAANGTVSGALNVRKNKRITIDSIEVKGNLKLSKNYLYNYLGIAPGDLYSESRLLQISKRLRELQFVREKQPFTVLFAEKYTKLTLYLDKRPAGQFDGIVGALPNPQTGKILFTGDARLRLLNSFAKGELIDINWRRLQEQTQDLKARFVYPYIFRTPAGTDYSIKLYRRDTSFIDVQQSLGLNYLFSAGKSIKAYVNRRSSNLLSTSAFENLTVLPPFADISSTSYGLGVSLEDYDYRFNPRKGYSFTMTADAGTRNIRKNARLNPVVYDNITLNSLQYGSALTGDYFIPFGKRNTVRTAVQAAWFYNSKGLFRNELMRIGGLKTLRGFDEESIFASSFAIGTLEYRFLLEENSWFFVFGDFCWYETNTSGQFATDTPYGFGTGITFETKAGIFALTYALGSQYGQSPDFRAGKIHVGFVGLF